MDGPKQILWNNFCSLVWPSTLEHHRQQEKCLAFFHHDYDYFMLFDNQNLVSFFYIRMPTQKQAFSFLKRNSYTNVCLKFLYDAKLITPFLSFSISGKNFSKIIGGWVTFPWRIQVSSFKVNVYSFSFLLKPQSWSNRNVKQETITRNSTYELPHQLPNNLGLTILGNAELLRLFI